MLRFIAKFQFCVIERRENMDSWTISSGPISVQIFISTQKIISCKRRLLVMYRTLLTAPNVCTLFLIWILFFLDNDWENYSFYNWEKHNWLFWQIKRALKRYSYWAYSEKIIGKQKLLLFAPYSNLQFVEYSRLVQKKVFNPIACLLFF